MGVFHVFLNCRNGIKSRTASQIIFPLKQTKTILKTPSDIMTTIVHP